MDNAPVIFELNYFADKHFFFYMYFSTSLIFFSIHVNSTLHLDMLLQIYSSFSRP